jgi:putative flippase GtrA
MDKNRKEPKQPRTIMKSMLTKVLALVQTYQKIINYLITGVLTTGVNYVIFYSLYYVVGFNSTISNSVAVFCAVAFAYVTNKWFVFKSKTESKKQLLQEATAFVVSRGFTIVLEIAGVYLLIEVIDFYPMISKLAISLFVIVFNYFVAHFYVFKNQKK